MQIINLIPATVRITDELQLETQGNIVTPYISQQLFLSDDIIPINGITSNPIDTLEKILEDKKTWKNTSLMFSSDFTVLSMFFY